MTDLVTKLKAHEAKLAVVGLGYVGLPIALAFAKKGIKVIGFDVNEPKVLRLRDGVDDTGEASADDLKQAKENIVFTTNPQGLKEALFIIVAVPTPIDDNKAPDLTPLIKASEFIGRYINKGVTIVFESTVYPGVTEEHCVPVIEKTSGYSWAQGDFFVGYSPERINPGDKEHTLERIVKVVSGQNTQVCQQVAKVYEVVVAAGVFQAQSIKVAEAAKVIENTQRDLNIALMNELSVIFDKMGIDTQAVLQAAGTKWNFLKFHPGLVGGHCIGVDPYYLTSKAEQLGYHPQVVLAGRRINDSMGAYVAQQTIKQMIKAKKIIEGANVLVLGLTFKENVPDFRNSRVVDIIRELKTYGTRVWAYDPYLKDHEHELESCEFERADLTQMKDVDAIILATPHESFKQYTFKDFQKMIRKNNGRPVLIDLRWVYSESMAQEAGFHYWRL